MSIQPLSTSFQRLTWMIGRMTTMYKMWTLVRVTKQTIKQITLLSSDWNYKKLAFHSDIVGARNAYTLARGGDAYTPANETAQHGGTRMKCDNPKTINRSGVYIYNKLCLPFWTLHKAGWEFFDASLWKIFIWRKQTSGKRWNISLRIRNLLLGINYY